MKNNFFVEFNGISVSENELTLKAKEVWKNEGNLVKDLKSIDLYYKPDESKCYYVFNGEVSGSFNV